MFTKLTAASIAVAAVIASSSSSTGVLASSSADTQLQSCLNMGYNQGHNDWYNVVCNSAYFAVDWNQTYAPHKVASGFNVTAGDKYFSAVPSNCTDDQTSGFRNGYETAWNEKTKSAQKDIYDACFTQKGGAVPSASTVVSKRRLRKKQTVPLPAELHAIAMQHFGIVTTATADDAEFTSA